MSSLRVCISIPAFHQRMVVARLCRQQARSKFLTAKQRLVDSSVALFHSSHHYQWLELAHKLILMNVPCAVVQEVHSSSLTQLKEPLGFPDDLADAPSLLPATRNHEKVNYIDIIK